MCVCVYIYIYIYFDPSLVALIPALFAFETLPTRELQLFRGSQCLLGALEWLLGCSWIALGSLLGGLGGLLGALETLLGGSQIDQKSSQKSVEIRRRNWSRSGEPKVAPDLRFSMSQRWINLNASQVRSPQKTIKRASEGISSYIYIYIYRYTPSSLTPDSSPPAAVC